MWCIAHAGFSVVCRVVWVASFGFHRSHIPFDRNGIKFYRADGEITKVDEDAILKATVTLPELIDISPLPEPELALPLSLLV